MIEEIFSAKKLPEEWDALVEKNCYLTRDFLEFLEITEKKQLDYVLFRDDHGKLDSILVKFRMTKYNLTMFTKHKLIMDVTMIYIPVSISRPAFVIGDKTMIQVCKYIKLIKGQKLILNCEESLRMKGFTKGRTCPRCILDVRWNTFQEYLDCLRSNYRYRYKKALKKSKNLTIKYLQDNKMFDDSLYNLYQEVYDNSTTKLEKLTIDYFKSNRFKIFVLYDNDEPLGFIQLLANGSELIFEFVGFDHAHNNTYDTYITMLIEVVKYAIENGFRTIDFGQTADDAKLKLGCRYEYLNALIHHSNPFINFVNKVIARWIQYKPLCESQFHVFKEKDTNV